MVVAVYFAIPKKFRALRNYFLVVCSLFFYAWGEPKFVYYMLTVVFINYALGLIASKFIDNDKNIKIIVIITVLTNVSFLFYFKYLNFALENLKRVGLYNEEIIKIVLPIGISFFTFQAMSYVFDICMKRAKAQRNPINVILYVCLFPQLVAGPIVRFKTIATEINQRNETLSDFTYGVKRFVIGLGKKCIIANSLAPTADFCFNTVGQTSGALDAGLSSGIFYIAWIGAIAYSLQIYFDFSGYSDMAIGLGRMFGFHFEENFNYPYISKSISEFWRRWHISMGSWFRDYVYFPLGGSRVDTTFLLFRNLFIVWLVTGIWHGANWTFIVWGLWHFLWIAIEKEMSLLHIGNRVIDSKGYYLLTLLVVVIGWVCFRSNNLPQAIEYLQCMFLPLTISNEAMNLSFAAKFLFKDCVFILLLGILFSSPFIFIHLEKKLPGHVLNIIYLTIFILSISFSLTSSYDPFIYFNF